MWNCVWIPVEHLGMYWKYLQWRCYIEAWLVLQLFYPLFRWETRRQLRRYRWNGHSKAGSEGGRRASVDPCWPVQVDRNSSSYRSPHVRSSGLRQDHACQSRCSSHYRYSVLINFKSFGSYGAKQLEKKKIRRQRVTPSNLWSVEQISYNNHFFLNTVLHYDPDYYIIDYANIALLKLLDFSKICHWITISLPLLEFSISLKIFNFMFQFHFQFSISISSFNFQF